MHAHITHQIFKWTGHSKQFTHLVFFFLALGKNRLLLSSLFKRQGLGLNHWNKFRKLIAKVIGKIKHAACIANDGARGHGSKRNNLANRITPVTLAHIVNNALAFFLAEVDVEVGHAYPLGV